MVCGVYKITNNINGKAYIGASSNIEERWQSHKTSSNQYIHKAILKYGLSNFSFEIIEECSEKELFYREREYVSLYNTKFPNGYNMNDGGECINDTGYYRVGRYYIKDKRNYNIIYRYRYLKSNVHKEIMSVDIQKLEKKVKEKGLPWKVIDEENAKKTLIESSQRITKYVNSTGFYRVSRNKENSTYQGFLYRYRYYDENKKAKAIVSTDINELKQKVENKGLPWIVLNEDIANKTLEENKANFIKFRKQDKC